MKLKACFTILFFLIALFTSPALAITHHFADQIDLAWNAMPAPDQGINEFEIFVKNRWTQAAEPVLIDTIAGSATQYTLTLAAQGRYIFGIRTKNTIVPPEGVTDEPVVMFSGFAWSDDPAACADGKIFTLNYFIKPLPPGNIKKAAEA